MRKNCSQLLFKKIESISILKNNQQQLMYDVMHLLANVIFSLMKWNLKSILYPNSCNPSRLCPLTASHESTRIKPHITTLCLHTFTKYNPCGPNTLLVHSNLRKCLNQPNCHLCQTTIPQPLRKEWGNSALLMVIPGEM